MGTHGLCARVRVGTLAGGRRGRRVIAPFVVSIGLLPALAGCSSFSSPLLLHPIPSDPRPHLRLPLQVPLPLEGGVTVGPPPLGSLLGSDSTPSAAPSSGHPGDVFLVTTLRRLPHRRQRCRPRSPYAPSTQTAAAVPPSVSTSSSSPGLCRSHFRARWCDGWPSSFGPSHGRHGAQRPPRQSFQIQFDAVRGAVKYAAPAEHLHRLGAALHATARSGCPAGASAGKFRAVMIVSAQNWVSS